MCAHATLRNILQNRPTLASHRWNLTQFLSFYSFVVVVVVVAAVVVAVVAVAVAVEW